MANLKSQLLELINSMADEPETGGEIADNDTGEEVTENESGEGATEPGTGAETDPKETNIEPSTVEQTQINAAEIPKDITVVNAADMVEQSLDMRLAAFYEKQVELENTVKILLQEVNTLKAHFEEIETAIDVAAETSPTVASIESLINQL